MRRALAGAALLACVSAGAVLGQAQQGRLVYQDQDFAVRSRVDWSTASLQVEISRRLDPSAASLPEAKGEAESDIQSRIRGFMISAIAPIPVDSSHSYGDLLKQDPDLFTRVSTAAAGARSEGTSLSQDFSRLIDRYSLPLFGADGIAAPLFPSRSVPVPRRLGWVPTRPFTGLVIDAQGRLPRAGGGGTAPARPALFPRIFDEDMTLVLDRSMCSPDALQRWGMVGYAAGLDDASALLRAGAFPLRLVARGVFGDNDTDIVIPTDDARRLLILAENRNLLRDGRIVIVYDSLDERGLRAR